MMSFIEYHEDSCPFIDCGCVDNGVGTADRIRTFEVLVIFALVVLDYCLSVARHEYISTDTFRTIANAVRRVGRG